MVEGITNLAVIEWVKKNYVVAKDYLDLAIKYNPRYFPALYNLGILFLEKAGATDVHHDLRKAYLHEAAEYWRRARAAKPDSADVRQALFNLYQALKELGELKSDQGVMSTKMVEEKAVDNARTAAEKEKVAAEQVRT